MAPDVEPEALRRAEVEVDAAIAEGKISRDSRDRWIAAYLDDEACTRKRLAGLAALPWP